MFIYVRVISKLSNSAFNTTFASGQQSQLFIYCHQVDQVLTIGTQNQLMKTRLGEQGIAGIVLDSLPGTILEPKYEEFWPILEFSPSHFSNLIRTQLRIATLLYWTAPHIASSICYFITLATAQQSGASHIYMLATSIQQQILADSTTSNGVSYVPVLSSDHYRSSLIRAIDIANEYELGYKSLIKQNADLQNLEASLDIMLSQADANLAQQKLAADSAFTRWQNAEAVYSKARLTFSQRVISLRSRAVELESGIAQYRIKKGAELFLTILSTTISKYKLGVWCISSILTLFSNCCSHWRSRCRHADWDGGTESKRTHRSNRRSWEVCQASAWHGLMAFQVLRDDG